MTKRKNEKKVAIVISTKNRPEYINGLLRYYASIKSQHSIYIGDASDPHHTNQVIPTISSLKNCINIVHKQYPEYSKGPIDNGITIKTLLEIVEEEYVVFSGDDDYFFPRSLDNCVDFLETNQDFTSAHGFGSYIRYDENIGESTISGRYNISEYQGNSGSERIKMLMENFSVLIFGVQRKEQFMAAYKNMELLKNPMFVEFMPVGLISILGKSKKLNELHLVRGTHETRYKQPNLRENLLDPEWSRSLEIYINTLSEELGRTDDLCENDAKEIVKQCFLDYIEKDIREVYCKKEVTPLENISNRMLNRVKQSIPIYVKKFIKNTILSDDYYDSSVLSKASPYHKEFALLLSTWKKIHEDKKYSEEEKERKCNTHIKTFKKKSLIRARRTVK